MNDGINLVLFDDVVDQIGLKDVTLATSELTRDSMIMRDYKEQTLTNL